MIKFMGGYNSHTYLKATITQKGSIGKMGLLKILIAFVVIGTLEIIAKFKDKNDERCFEIAMSILFAGWIINGQW